MSRSCANRKLRSPRRSISLAAPVLRRSKFRRVRQLSFWYKGVRTDRGAGAKQSMKKLTAVSRSVTQHATEVIADTKVLDGPTIAADDVETRPSISDDVSTSIRCKRLFCDPAAAVLALTTSSRRQTKMQRVEASMSGPESSSAGTSFAPSPPKPKMDAAVEIQRILEAEAPEDVLNIGRGESDEEVVNQAWKRLVLLLHPDKLQRLEEESREAGAQALHYVHNAKEELKRRSQEMCAEVPEEPLPEGPARCIDGVSGSRKYEISWKLPSSQNPKRPVEKYEIWGPKYFSEAGEPFDWVLLATLPPLQQHFVLVEEAPTQQDVMWAADRVLRRTLPLSVNAANGKGASTPLTFEMPWASEFPWLQGNPSVLCPRCCQLSQRRGAWSKCGGCGFSVPAENALVVRCTECQGEVLWSHSGAELSCSCCFKKFGGVSAKDQWKQPRQPARPPPSYGAHPMQNSGPRWGRTGGGRSGGGGRSRNNYF